MASLLNSCHVYESALAHTEKATFQILSHIIHDAHVVSTITTKQNNKTQGTSEKEYQTADKQTDRQTE